jgi:hypothetical protein
MYRLQNAAPLPISPNAKSVPNRPQSNLGPGLFRTTNTKGKTTAKKTPQHRELGAAQARAERSNSLLAEKMVPYFENRLSGLAQSQFGRPEGVLTVARPKER